MRGWRTILVAVGLLVAFLLGYRRLMPIYRVEAHSELVMLGDLNGDHQWDSQDLKVLHKLLADPFRFPADLVWRMDLNQNGRLDSEDLGLLTRLVEAGGDPYRAESQALNRTEDFPRPREFYKYLSVAEYRARPIWVLPYPAAETSKLVWFKQLRVPGTGSAYAEQLEAALFSETVRLDLALRKREAGLNDLERRYLEDKLEECSQLFNDGRRADLLLEVMGLVEDAETLTVQGQSDFCLHLLVFRDHLRRVLGSTEFREMQQGKRDCRDILKTIDGHLKTDLGMDYDLIKLGPPRDLTHLENYLQRGEWQYYKSSTRTEDFQQLLQFAQHDPRYLRAVSRTSRKLHDPLVQNHNLPMVLLFREALRIKGGDKKQAVGLLDEAIRVPFGWIKSIPRKHLPGALAMDNFLLPGNKEDGADKSRHWNVFGGVCIYKSPQEAVDLGLKREMKDLREGQFSPGGMTEFLRDMIANLNGMYHVMSVDPGLLERGKSNT